MNDPARNDEMVLNLRDRWAAIQLAKHSLADEFDQMVADYPGSGAQRLRRLSEWFRGPADFDEALEQPDVLAVCLPLLKCSNHETSDLTTALAQAARIGFCTLVSRPVFVSQAVLSMFRISMLQLSWIGPGAVITSKTATDQSLPSKVSISTRLASTWIESDRDESGAVITLTTRLDSNGNRLRPDPIQLASRVESDRIGCCDRTYEISVSLEANEELKYSCMK